jgi:hypothetical protein
VVGEIRAIAPAQLTRFVPYFAPLHWTLPSISVPRSYSNGRSVKDDEELEMEAKSEAFGENGISSVSVKSILVSDVAGMFPSRVVANEVESSGSEFTRLWDCGRIIETIRLGNTAIKTKNIIVTRPGDVYIQ